MDKSSENDSNHVFEFFQKVSGYLVGFTLILYLAGFTVTNLYLGSLGVINLDILKSRYILSGVLFLLV